MTDHPLHADRRPVVSWTWLSVVVLVVAFWTTVALFLESAIGT